MSTYKIKDSDRMWIAEQARDNQHYVHGLHRLVQTKLGLQLNSNFVSQEGIETAPAWSDALYFPDKVAIIRSVTIIQRATVRSKEN